MCQVTKYGVGDHDMPRILAGHVVADHELPWRHQVLIGSIPQCLARLGHSSLERGYQFAALIPLPAA